MSTIKQEHALIWVCDDCMFAHANGEHGERPDDEPEVWSNIAPGDEVTMGLLYSEHDESCPNFSATDERPAGDHECDCAVREFDTAPCGGCGSYLHGRRHAFTIWWTPAAAS